MKKILLMGLVLISIFVIFSGYSKSAEITLSVEENQSSEMNIVSSDLNESSPKSLEVEVTNKGSIPFIGQFRLDVFDEEGKILRTWSDKSILEPGSAKNEKFFFFRPDSEGQMTARLTFHYGLENTITKEVNITTEETNVSEGFEIDRIRTYEDEIYLAISCPEKSEQLFATIESRARKFEQQTGSCEDGREYLTLNYEPEIKEDDEVKLILGETEGRYYYTKSLNLERIKAWKVPILRFYDNLIEILL